MRYVVHSSPTLHSLFTHCSPSGDCSLTVHSLFTHCSLTVHSLFTHCSLTVQSLFTQCSLAVRSLFTHCSGVPLLDEMMNFQIRKLGYRLWFREAFGVGTNGIRETPPLCIRYNMARLYPGCRVACGIITCAKCHPDVGN
jgi:hypothetical protein